MPKASPVGPFRPFFSRPPFQTLSQMAHHVCSNPSFPYMKNKFLFFFLLLLFCFSDFGFGLFCCEIFSHQTEIGDSKAGAELLDIILTKVHISLSLSLCVEFCLLVLFLLCVRFVGYFRRLFYCFWKIHARLEHWADNIVIFPIPKVVYSNQFPQFYCLTTTRPPPPKKKRKKKG